MKEDELISKLVLISFTCLWFIVLFTFGLLVYQSATHTNQIDELIKSIEFFNSIEGK
tara:strand:- start:371 stop:541 length:171 start_codon:yes stop_codon:yes gene_type:complete